MEKPKSFYFYSGGADGSDTIWKKVASEYQTNFIVISFKVHSLKQSGRIIELTPNLLKKAQEYVERANVTLSRNLTNLSLFSLNLLRRNWYIVQNVDAVFAITYLEENFRTCMGGTAWPVQMAIDEGKNVFVFDMGKNKWFYFNSEENKFVEYKNGIPKLFFYSALVGARKITDYGEKAIHDVFKITFQDI